MHIWLGRVAYVLNIFAPILGFVTYFNPVPANINVPFIVTLTIGGGVQIISSIAGIHYIRQYRFLKRIKESHAMMTSVNAGGGDENNNIVVKSDEPNPRCPCCVTRTGTTEGDACGPFPCDYSGGWAKACGCDAPFRPLMPSEGVAECCVLLCDGPMCCSQPCCGPINWFLSHSPSNEPTVELEKRMDAYLRGHIVANTFLFFVACLAPAMVRVPFLLGIDGSAAFGPQWAVWSWILPFIAGFFHIRALYNKSFF